MSTIPALTCPFAEVVEIAPQPFLERGISRMECLEWSASRQVALRQDALRFPAHAPRTTRTPQTDPCWVKRDTAWEVVGG